MVKMRDSVIVALVQEVAELAPVLLMGLAVAIHMDCHPLCACTTPLASKACLWAKKTEFETTYEHWTVVDPECEAEAERIAQENRKYFDQVLVKHPEWGAFFTRFEDLEVGDKIGEGGQAEIFAATSQSFKPDVDYEVELVWKGGVSLKDLERQWPPQMLLTVTQGGGKWPFQNVLGGAFIRDGEFTKRFAFVMRRRWVDLRTCIDQRMLGLLQDESHGPPFSDILSVYDFILLAIWK